MVEGQTGWKARLVPRQFRRGSLGRPSNPHANPPVKNWQSIRIVEFHHNHSLAFSPCRKHRLFIPVYSSTLVTVSLKVGQFCNHLVAVSSSALYICTLSSYYVSEIMYLSILLPSIWPHFWRATPSIGIGAFRAGSQGTTTIHREQTTPYLGHKDSDIFGEK